MVGGRQTEIFTQHARVPSALALHRDFQACLNVLALGAVDPDCYRPDFYRPDFYRDKEHHT